MTWRINGKIEFAKEVGNKRPKVYRKTSVFNLLVFTSTVLNLDCQLNSLTKLSFECDLAILVSTLEFSAQLTKSFWLVSLSSIRSLI